MKIAFSIPTYKRNKDLIRLLNSINTSYKLLDSEIELTIFIRDNDKDSDLTIDRLEKTCKEAKIIYKKNKYNEGLRLNMWRSIVEGSKHGEYVFLASDDDYILPDFFNTYISFLKKQPVNYLISNYYFQSSDLKSKDLQYGLEKPILENLINSPKENIIISNRILTGTCFSTNVINKMIDLCPKEYYESQWYIQFLGCFASSYKRFEEKLSIHQIDNVTYWESYDNHNDMVLSRLNGYKYAYDLIGANKLSLSNLILKSIINYPIWAALRIIFDKRKFFKISKFRYIFFKIFHLKIKRDFRLLLFYIYCYLRKIVMKKN